MKKLKTVALIFFICVFMCSCYDKDPYEGKRPTDCPNSYWVCEQYNVQFSVDEDKLLSDAQITIQSKQIPFSFLWWSFDNRVTIRFEVDSQKNGMLGYCEFSEDEFTITIDDTKGFYSEEQIVMEFIRVSEDEYLAAKNTGNGSLS